MRIPGFEMIERLGEGGMATVWKARQVSLDRVVAIKIMSHKLAGEPDDVSRFLHEAQSTAKLKHPGIIQVYDANVQEGFCYYIMEYVAGYTIGEWIRRKGRLQEKEAILIAECVADALGYAWEKESIIHCDIKPDNIIIDSDGTVKVADLGLSRTISAMGGGPELMDEIMGTACYMSPEQVQGHADMDCRADIYSLGAMLYHLVTGKMLFEGSSDDEAMEMQVSETVPDPSDFNPELSKPICWLIEKMLMKDRDHRHADWKAVLADIARVKRRMPLIGGPPQEGGSTVRRNKHRTHADFQVASTPTMTAEGDGSYMGALVVFALLLAVAAGVYFYVIEPRRHASSSLKQQRPAYVPVVTIPEQPADKNAKEMFEFAKKWATENPGQYDEIVKQFEKVAAQTKGKYPLMADVEIRKALAAKEEKVKEVLNKLETDTAGLLEKGELEEVVKQYETYNGPLAAETEQNRKAKAAEIRKHKEELVKAMQDKAKQAEATVNKAVDSVVSLLATGTVAQARGFLGKVMTDPSLEGKTDKLSSIDRLLSDAADLDKKILDSFRSQRGKEVTIEMMAGGKKTFVITDVTDNKVTATQKLNADGASMTFSFAVPELSAKEKLARMGSEDELADVALFKGLMALNSKAYTHARRCFAKTDPIIAGKLIAAVDDIERKSASDEAQKFLAQMIKSAGITVGPYNRDAWLNAVVSKKLAAGSLAMLGEALANFKSKYGSTDFAKEVEPILIALEQAVGQGESGPERNVARAVVSIPPEIAAIKGDAKAVMTVLLKKNPRLKEEQVRMLTDNGGKARQLMITGSDLENIWPVAALSDLELFSYTREGEEQGLVKDILPLRGLALESITIPNCKIADISALSQMPLKELNLALNTGIKDISSLKGMKIQSLNLSGAKVFDFLPLAGMPLKILNINETQAKNLSILKGMPLERLEIAGTKVHDFSFLEGLKQLRFLNLTKTQFKTPEILSGFSLDELYLGDTGVSDISALKGMKLKCLDVSRTTIKDFSVIKTMPLVVLNLTGTKYRDFRALSEMKDLGYLYLGDTEINDLAALKGLRLRALGIENTLVSDLSPLKGMPLNDLFCRGSSVKDFSVLRGAPVRRITIDDSVDRKALLAIFPQLIMINWVAVDR